MKMLPNTSRRRHAVRTLLAALLVGVTVAGCGTYYVNESDQPGHYVARRELEVSTGVERTYRTAYLWLDGCLSTYGYRVKGEFHHGAGARISVDQGIGFQNRWLFLADSNLLRLEIAPTPKGARVTVYETSKRSAPYAKALARRLAGEKVGCDV